LSAAGYPPGEAPPPEPTEEQLRAYEDELSRLTTTDVIAQATISMLNLGARRLAPAGADPALASERDLEQVRDAIDAARGLLGILERRIPPQDLAPLRDALSRLQMAYAKEVAAEPEAGAEPTPGAEPGAGAEGPGEGDGGAGEPPSQEEGTRRPGPAESSGRLWVPGS
jgi:hypothetical protein